MIAVASAESRAYPSHDELPRLILLKHPLAEYPIPLGPVGSRFAMCRLGLLREQQALEELRQEHTPPPRGYVYALLDIVLDLGFAGRHHEAMLLSEMLWTVVTPGPGTPFDDIAVDVAVSHIQAAARLIDLGANGPLFAHVALIAQRLLMELDPVRSPEPRARALSVMAQCILQAYGGHEGGIRWWSDPKNWQTQLSIVLPKELHDDLDRYEMPPALPQVHAAVGMLAEASDLRTGAARARTLATYAQALDLLSTDSDVPPSLIAQAARGALEDLDVDDRPAQWAACLELLARFDPESIGRISLTPIDIGTIRERHGGDAAASIVVRLAGLAHRWGAGLGLGRAAESLAAGLDEMDLPPPKRRGFLAAAAHLLHEEVLSCRQLEALPDPVSLLDERHDAGAITDNQYGQLLAHVAGHMQASVDERLQVARAATEWCANDPALAIAEFVLATAALEAAMELNDPWEACEAAAEAATAYLDVGLHPESQVAVRLGVDASSRAGDDADVVLLQSFSRRLLRLEVLGDAMDHEGLHGIALRCSESTLTRGTFSPELLINESQLFKALLFSAALDVRGPWPSDEVEQQQVAQIAELERLAADDYADGHDGWDEPSFFDERPELLRCAYLGGRERLAGSNVADQLANARLAFDERTTERRYRRIWGPHLERVDHLTPSMSYETICEQLGDDTVLLDIFLGVSSLRPDGHEAGDEQQRTPTVYVTLYAGNRSMLGIAALGSSAETHAFRDPSEHGRLVVLHMTSYLVAELRAALQEYATPDLVTRDADHLLEELSGYLLETVGPALTDLHTEGYRHLCLWPHGPMHLAPLHLLHNDGRLLADDWTVTTIPSTRCLLPPRFRSGRPPQTRVLSVGVPDGGVAYGLARAESLRTQADLVAARLETTALPVEQCTPEVVLERMQHARYIHLAAHGSASGGAPLWHHVYLTPNDEGEGRLFAHAVLGADLHDVELVTLSACESALGRVDVLDNGRGLPAAFLAAGAQAIIGTLWRVHPDPAAHFFGRLYDALAREEPRLEAFRTAQYATRQSFPEYRHWGAFTYVGGWK